MNEEESVFSIFLCYTMVGILFGVFFLVKVGYLTGAQKLDSISNFTSQYPQIQHTNDKDKN